MGRVWCMEGDHLYALAEQTHFKDSPNCSTSMFNTVFKTCERKKKKHKRNLNFSYASGVNTPINPPEKDIVVPKQSSKITYVKQGEISSTAELLHLRHRENLKAGRLLSKTPYLANKRAKLKLTDSPPAPKRKRDSQPSPKSNQKTRQKSLLKKKPNRKPDVICLSDSESDSESKEIETETIAPETPTETYESLNNSQSSYKLSRTLNVHTMLLGDKVVNFKPNGSCSVVLLASKLQFSMNDKTYSINYGDIFEWVYYSCDSIHMLTIKPVFQFDVREEFPSVNTGASDAELYKKYISFLLSADDEPMLREFRDVRANIELLFLVDKTKFTDKNPKYRIISNIVQFYDTSIAKSVVKVKPTSSNGTRGKENSANSKSSTNKLHNVILIWPPPPARDAVSLYDKDLERLRKQHVYLNDNIIDFYLKYIQLRLLDKERVEQFHFFNTFFYKAISKDKLISKEQIEKLMKWTGGIDIFSKQYLIIPINEHMHWNLAIVCFPGTKRQSILMFDSLYTIPHRLQATRIRHYLDRVWHKTRPGEKNNLKNDVWFPAYNLQVPQQQNGSDCGIFLLHFVEKFCTELEPRTEHESYSDEWFSQTEIDHKRDHIRAIIIRLKNEAQASTQETEYESP